MVSDSPAGYEMKNSAVDSVVLSIPYDAQMPHDVSNEYMRCVSRSVSRSRCVASHFLTGKQPIDISMFVQKACHINRVFHFFKNCHLTLPRRLICEQLR